MRATNATLAKGGFSSAMPRAVTNGPHLYGGITMRPLWAEQLIQQVQTVVKHLRCPGDCNLMFRITFYWAQVNTGMGFALLEHPQLSVPHFECKLFDSIRHGLAAIDGSLEISESFVVPHARDGDGYIMDSICDCQRFTKSALRQINACRLYLEVTLLSDIATPCGKCIAWHYYLGTKHRCSNWPTIQYPRQPAPDGGHGGSGDKHST